MISLPLTSEIMAKKKSLLIIERILALTAIACLILGVASSSLLIGLSTLIFVIAWGFLHTHIEDKFDTLTDRQVYFIVNKRVYPNTDIPVSDDALKKISMLLDENDTVIYGAQIRALRAHDVLTHLSEATSTL